MQNLDERRDVAKTSEYFVHRDSLTRLVSGVRRLKKLTKGVSNAKLAHWYRLVARFEMDTLEAKQRYVRADALAYLAAVLTNAADRAADRRSQRKRLLRRAEIRALVQDQKDVTPSRRRPR
jgi:hypothetical protein